MIENVPKKTSKALYKTLNNSDSQEVILIKAKIQNLKNNSLSKNLKTNTKSNQDLCTIARNISPLTTSSTQLPNSASSFISFPRRMMSKQRQQEQLNNTETHTKKQQFSSPQDEIRNIKSQMSQSLNYIENKIQQKKSKPKVQFASTSVSDIIKQIFSKQKAQSRNSFFGWMKQLVKPLIADEPVENLTKEKIMSLMKSYVQEIERLRRKQKLHRFQVLSKTDELKQPASAMNKQKRKKLEKEIINSKYVVDKIKEIISDMQKANALMQSELKQQEMFKPRSISPEFEQTYGMDILDPQVVQELLALYRSGRSYKYLPGISPLPSKQFEQKVAQNHGNAKRLDRKFTVNTVKYLDSAGKFARENSAKKLISRGKPQLDKFNPFIPELSQFK